LGELGNDKIVVRLGGIYALEGVMNTSKQYHQPVLEALCAFVRDGTKTDTGIQASLTVGRRAAGTGVVDLTGAHIPKANLLNADLTGATLNGAKLSGADLLDANLTDARLTDAILNGANLTDARLTGAGLNNANLLNAQLTRANLTGANVDQSQLDKAACSGAGTRLPSFLTLKPCH
jgi:uncharacterized protein YjbI with pentapeptide repeats